MNPEAAEKLLGGYAAGILTPAEREALFAAALEDQQLFDALAGEEPLRELLRDPAARLQLLAALDSAPEPWYCRPLSPALIGSVMAAFVLLAAVVYFQPLRRRAAVEVSQVQPGPVRPPVKPFRAPPPEPVRSSLPTELPPLLAPPAPPSLPVLTQAAPPPPPLQSAAGFEPAARPTAVRAAAVSPRAARFGLRYRILKKTAAGGLVEIDPQQELDREDEIALRLESDDGGYLTVLERVAQNLRPVANEEIRASTPYTIALGGGPPGESSREIFISFSRLRPANAASAAPGSSPSGQQVRGNSGRGIAVITTAAEPRAQQVSFQVTLKYR